MGNKKWVVDHFSQRLRSERESRGWSQAEMAEMLTDRGAAMHWTTVAKIERGERAVRIDEAAAAADLLGVSVDWLLGRKTAAPANELAHTLRGVVDTARTSGQQVAAIQSALRDRFDELATLDFDGSETVTADAGAAWQALTDAGDALGRLSAFKLPRSVRLRDTHEALLLHILNVSREDEDQ